MTCNRKEEFGCGFFLWLCGIIVPLETVKSIMAFEAATTLLTMANVGGQIFKDNEKLAQTFNGVLLAALGYAGTAGKAGIGAFLAKHGIYHVGGPLGRIMVHNLGAEWDSKYSFRLWVCVFIICFVYASWTIEDGDKTAAFAPLGVAAAYVLVGCGVLGAGCTTYLMEQGLQRSSANPHGIRVGVMALPTADNIKCIATLGTSAVLPKWAGGSGDCEDAYNMNRTDICF